MLTVPGEDVDTSASPPDGSSAQWGSDGSPSCPPFPQAPRTPQLRLQRPAAPAPPVSRAPGAALVLLPRGCASCARACPGRVAESGQLRDRFRRRGPRVCQVGAFVMELEGAHDEGEVAEGLRGVAELPAGDGSHSSLSRPTSLRSASSRSNSSTASWRRPPPYSAIDEPEGAGEEHALAAGQPVVAVIGAVAQHEAVVASAPAGSRRSVPIMRGSSPAGTRPGGSAAGWRPAPGAP